MGDVTTDVCDLGGDTLKTVFKFLTKEELADICPYLEFRSWRKGEVLMNDGEQGDFMGFVLDGKLAVKKETNFPGRFTLIAILDRGYQGVRVRGYDAALAVALGKRRDDMKHVLEQIAEIIKASQRAMHTRWVFVQCLSRLDWQTRRRITETLLAEIGLSGSAPDRFVKSIPELVNIYVVGAHSLRKHLAPPVFSELPETASPDQPLILMKDDNAEEVRCSSTQPT